MDVWTYDAIGNRLTNTVNGTPLTYAYFKNGSNPLNGQRLASDGVNAYTYDANGNTATRAGSGGSFTFGWNPDDRMTSISGDTTASYAYDFQGRRSSKTVTGSSTAYLYDGLNLVRAVSATTTVDYLFGPGIDEPLASAQGGSISYFSVDGLGSVHLLGDSDGNVQDTTLYDAWGVIRAQSSSLANDFGYTAREFGEAALWFYRARYYQPAIGRFASEDPLKMPLGFPDFKYVGNDPLKFGDSSGMQYTISPHPLPWGGCISRAAQRHSANQMGCEEEYRRCMRGSPPCAAGTPDLAGGVYRLSCRVEYDLCTFGAWEQYNAETAFCDLMNMPKGPFINRFLGAFDPMFP